MKKHTKAPERIVEIVSLAELPASVLKDATIIGSAKAPRSTPHRAGHGATKQTKVRVLVVDDDLNVADASAQVLHLFGYECYAVYNHTDAIAAAESFRPDVILSDVIMKGLNGVELCLQIKQMLPDCRVLLLSGEVSTAHTLIQDSRKQGYNFELVAKPVRPQELVAKIEHLFGGAYSPMGTHAASR